MTRKEAILKTAITLFSKKGYGETSMAEISNLSNVAEGTVFYHFKNKETLLLAVLERTKKDITREFENYLGNKNFSNGMDMMENAVSFYLYLVGKLEHQFLLLHCHFPYKLAEKNSECQRHLESIFDCLVDIFETAIQLGIQDGSMAPLSPRKTALIIFSMVDGVARFKTYNLYNANTLFNEILDSCRRMLAIKP